jgi:hypothetical protein
MIARNAGPVAQGGEWQMEWLPPGSHESQRAFPTPAAAGSRCCEPWRLQTATLSTRFVDLPFLGDEQEFNETSGLVDPRVEGDLAGALP